VKLKKSYIQMYASGCPKQFEDIYIKRLYEMPRSQPMVRGSNFHNWGCKFFDLVKWEELKPLKTYEDIVRYMRIFLPKEIEDQPLKTAMLNFCNFEAKHYLAVKEMGPQFFFPLEREFLIDTETIEAHIDRIDLLNFDNGIAVMEYKLMSSWGAWAITHLRRELVFYSIVLNTVEKYKGRAHHIQAYNPLLDKYMFEPIHRNTVAAVIRWIRRFKNACDKGDFPRRPGPRCVTCPSAEECFLKDERVPEPIV